MPAEQMPPPCSGTWISHYCTLMLVVRQWGPGSRERTLSLALHAHTVAFSPTYTCLSPALPAGTAAAFMCWAALHHKQQQRQQGPGAPIGAGTADGAATSSGGTARDVSLTDSLVVATYAACTVMRHASAAAFAAHERSMLAGDIIPHLHPALKDVIERR